MPHGLPDWGLAGPKETTYGLDDLGEHAVRLGSPHLWDRRGDVLELTDFREGLGCWEPWLGGVGAAVQLWTGHSRTGAYSVLCITGSTAGMFGGLVNHLPYPVLSRWGFEFSFSVGAATRFWEVGINWETPATIWHSEIRLNFLLGSLQYWNGAWQTFAPCGPLIGGLNPRHTFKFVVDATLAQPEYVRAILNDLTHPMAGMLVNNAGAGGFPVLTVYVRHVTNVASNDEAYLDNLIVTQNEP